jgi:hypothetical protein
VFDKIRKRGTRIVEADSSKVTAGIASPGKAIGDFRQKASKNVDLVENYIQKLDWRVSIILFHRMLPRNIG